MHKKTRLIFVVLSGVLLTSIILILGGFAWYVLVINPFCVEDDIACWEKECTSNDHPACDEYFEKPML